MLCAGSTSLLVQSKVLDEAPYKLSGAVAKLASITFTSLAFSYRLINLGFLLRENLLPCSSYLLLGVPNWAIIYINTVPQSSYFLASLPGRKKTSARGVLHAHPLLCLLFCFILFFLASFYQKYKKKLVPSIVVIFVGLLLSCFIMVSINGWFL
jgi:hypothetical protein